MTPEFIAPEKFLRLSRKPVVNEERAKRAAVTEAHQGVGTDHDRSGQSLVVTVCVVLTFWLLALNVTTGFLSFMTKSGVGARAGMVSLINQTIEALLVAPFGRPAAATMLFLVGCGVGLTFRRGGRSPVRALSKSKTMAIPPARPNRSAVSYTHSPSETESDPIMTFRISKAQLDDILSRAKAVEAEFLRFADARELNVMRDDALAIVGHGVDKNVLQQLENTLAKLDDVSLAEAAAISVAGDGSYAPEEMEELVADLMDRTSRDERMKMLTSEPLIGSMFGDGMRCLGLSD